MGKGKNLRNFRLLLNSHNSMHIKEFHNKLNRIFE